MPLNQDTVRSSVRDLLDIAFRHKGKMALFFVLSVVIISLLAYAIPNVYQSEAKLLIRFGRENLAVNISDKEQGGQLIYDRFSQESQVNSEVSILKSRPLIEEVVETIGPEAILSGSYAGGGDIDPTALEKMGRSISERTKSLNVAMKLEASLLPVEEAVKNISRNLSVEVPDKSNVVKVVLEAGNRHLAKNALDLLIALYLERHIQVNAANAPPVFFEEQRDRSLEALLKAEKELDNFRETYGVSSIGERQSVLLDQIRELENDMKSAKALAEASEKSIESIGKMISEEKKVIELSRMSGAHNYAVDPMKERLMLLRLEEADLGLRYADDHPPLVKVRKQIAIAENILSGEEDTHTEVRVGINENYQALERDLQTEKSNYAAQKNRWIALADMVAAKNVQLAEISSQEVELNALVRAVDMAEEEYQQYHDNLRRARISEALDKSKVSNVTVIEPATLPLTPVRPRRLFIIFLGIIFGLLGALGIAYTFNYFDDTFKKDSDVENWLELPVLASISEQEFHSFSSQKRR